MNRNATRGKAGYLTEYEKMEALVSDEVMVLVKGSELQAMLRRVVEDTFREHGASEMEELLNTAKLAKVLDVSEDLIRLKAREEGLPHVRVGPRKLRFRLNDVLA